MEKLPIPEFSAADTQAVVRRSVDIRKRTQRVRERELAFADWLSLTFDFDRLPTSLDHLSAKSEKDAITAILAAFPKRAELGAADLTLIRKEFKEMIAPAHQDWIAIQSLERELSDLVNAAYGLNSEDVNLMWRTAPPRMPFYP